MPNRQLIVLEQIANLLKVREKLNGKTDPDVVERLDEVIGELRTLAKDKIIDAEDYSLILKRALDILAAVAEAVPGFIRLLKKFWE